MKKFLLAGVAAIAFASGAQAADLGVARGPVASAIIAPVFGWTGFYAGLQAGYGWGRSNGVGCNFALTLCDNYSSNANGFVLGGHVGYNYQINQVVLGLEADLEYNFGRTTSTFFLPNNGATYANRVGGGAQGSIRGRLGFAVDRALIYATGGVAFSGNNYTWAIPPGAPFSNFSRTSVGWTLGAGVEYAFTPNWTARVEYRYANFGRTRFASAVANQDVTQKLDTHTVRLGVSYLFSTGGSAVVARY
jgi:outer membrane immunogenic protein